MRLSRVVSAVLVMASVANAAKLKPETIAAFNTYVHATEQRMTVHEGADSFLWIDHLPVSERDRTRTRLRGGEVITQKLHTLVNGRPLVVSDGLIHHWLGIAFIPGVSLEKTVSFLQDYDHQYSFYAPEVQRSRLLSRRGDDFHIFLQLRRKKVVTVVLNTEYDVQYKFLGTDRAIARSVSTRISQVENAGQRNESEKPVGDDDGFLWRLNSYWRLAERDGGTYIQLEVISLTRDIPAGMDWLIRPFIASVPEESLSFTLRRTRSGLSEGRAVMGENKRIPPETVSGGFWESLGYALARPRPLPSLAAPRERCRLLSDSVRRISVSNARATASEVRSPRATRLTYEGSHPTFSATRL